MSDLGLQMDTEPRSRRKGKGPSRKRRNGGGRNKKDGGRSGLAVLIAFLVVIGLVVGVGYLGYGYLEKQFGPPPDYSGGGEAATVVVIVKSGDYGPAIGNELKAAGVIKSVDAFTKALREDPEQRGSKIQPGAYLMHKHMAASAALEMMADPSSRQQVTVTEGERATSVYAAIAKQLNIPVDQVVQASKDPSLGLPAWANGNIEGFLYPLPYPAAPGMSPVDILKNMVATSTARYQAPGGLVDSAQKAGRKPYDVLIVASLIEAEARHDDDRAKVAEVVYNRLTKNMTLGLDSTVNYALGISTTQLTQAQLNTDTPYNTRKYKGLPPGPIDNPGQPSIDAALNPATGDLLYFVTTNPADGTTDFTDSASQFQALEAKLQQWYKDNPSS